MWFVKYLILVKKNLIVKVTTFQENTQTDIKTHPSLVFWYFLKIGLWWSFYNYKLTKFKKEYFDISFQSFFPSMCVCVCVSSISVHILRLPFCHLELFIFLYYVHCTSEKNLIQMNTKKPKRKLWSN